MTKKLFQPHYDRDFKRQVIEEYLSTGCSKMSLLRKYNIQFKSAIQTWMRILGYTDTKSEIQWPNFGEISLISLPKQSSKTAESMSDLEKKIRELERQLDEERLRSEAYARIIDKAEKEFKLPIKKKFNTK